MTKLMETLYDYILDNTLEQYYNETAFHEWYEKRETVGRELWEQLPPEQKLKLEALQHAYDRAQLAELEAMFLASFDEIIALYRPHCTQAAVPAAPL